MLHTEVPLRRVRPYPETQPQKSVPSRYDVRQQSQPAREELPPSPWETRDRSQFNSDPRLHAGVSAKKHASEGMRARPTRAPQPTTTTTRHVTRPAPLSPHLVAKPNLAAASQPAHGRYISEGGYIDGFHSSNARPPLNQAQQPPNHLERDQFESQGRSPGGLRLPSRSDFYHNKFGSPYEVQQPNYDPRVYPSRFRNSNPARPDPYFTHFYDEDPGYVNYPSSDAFESQFYDPGFKFAPYIIFPFFVVERELFIFDRSLNKCLAFPFSAFFVITSVVLTLFEYKSTFFASYVCIHYFPFIVINMYR